MNIKAKKSLGQNFLQDEAILENIANSIITCPNDLIIEIGPGKGALTKYLKAKNNYLICYEIDIRFREILNKLTNSKTTIIYKDFLQADILNDIKDIPYHNIYLIANIPYYITTPIIKKVIDLKLIKSMTLLVQEEVAQRLTAKPQSKAYGSLTVYLNYYYEIKYLFKVPKEAFNPLPKVDSAVVLFKQRKNNLKVYNEKMLFNLIEDAFKLKRKTLKNNLKTYDWSKIAPILIKHNLNELVRAEELPLSIFIDIANNLD